MGFFSSLFAGGSAAVPEGAAAVAVPESFTCPITHDVMQDPVIDRGGNSYERAAIESWVREHGSSPITREPMSLADLTNRGLADSIKPYQALRADTWWRSSPSQDSWWRSSTPCKLSPNSRPVEAESQVDCGWPRLCPIAGSPSIL